MANATATLATITEDLELIERIAIEAGQLALPYFRGDTDLDVQIKEGNSPVSAADFAVNAYLEKHLKAARPDYGWLSEETADTEKALRMNAPRTFVVDPIDGTRGFIEGRDMWCVSVGVIENSRPVAGVLVCPAREQILKASSGAGAYLNDVQIKLTGKISDRVIIGGPRVFLDALDGRTDEKFERHPHVPSLAYRIALVAMGQMTATFVKPNAHDWDIAAADIILHEAGGSLCDVDGENFLLNQENPKKSVMFATHPEFSKKMLAIVTETPFS